MRVQLIDAVPECRDLRRVSFVFSGQQQPAHAVGGLTKDGSAILWLGFAFESVSTGIFLTIAYTFESHYS